MNVLVYAGKGSSPEAVRHACHQLRWILSPYYAVSTVDADALTNHPWPAYTACLVMPGGADLPYCEALNGEANRKILNWIRSGGKYIGFCAGGYYGSARVEFELGTPIAVQGSRELKLFPGTARGCAYPGFVYDSESGARATTLRYANGETATYYNGGGVFVDADSTQNTTVLARYTEKPLAVDGGDAAVVRCTVGKGVALLTGLHPEFSAEILRRQNSADPNHHLSDPVLKKLLDNDQSRMQFLRYLAGPDGLGLKVAQEIKAPTPTSLFISSISSQVMDEFVAKCVEPLADKDGYFQGQTDRFQFITAGSLEYTKALSDAIEDKDQDDPNKKLKTVVLYRGPNAIPDSLETPFFNHSVYYRSLVASHEQLHSNSIWMGITLMYADVITSTNTIMDGNFSLLKTLPHGFTATAAQQVAGKGRAGNVWVSPHGSLPFSVFLRHPYSPSSPSPSVIFIQYLAALAITEAVCSGDYQEMPVRIKWPNDLYIKNVEHEHDSSKPEYTKICGILVSSSLYENEYLVVVGCGINCTNYAPTTSLNTVLHQIVNPSRKARGLSELPDFNREGLLGRILAYFEVMYDKFKYEGFAPFLDRYYGKWLHQDKIIRLQEEGGVPCRIKGIDLEFGMLEVAAVDDFGRETGQKYSLQPDGNSFDMLNGLIKRKQ
ncbi:hypothetical protein CANCADRAFT_86662 [Tortispora caseinolytica NRRL Y-17796]|uniref:BPL/LPL catalytic domain-containing protein n=1 Tax=Tortispora caseinolytica NRRL Y-17796 TaxID=767744 RepID=A0A1E4TL04_9ASCO|nr:hypothetical protein CANCADRAFT_86662 [Tortispora caseinolytica NRRL Y-17796]